MQTKISKFCMFICVDGVTYTETQFNNSKTVSQSNCRVFQNVISQEGSE